MALIISTWDLRRRYYWAPFSNIVFREISSNLYSDHKNLPIPREHCLTGCWCWLGGRLT